MGSAGEYAERCYAHQPIAVAAAYAGVPKTRYRDVIGSAALCPK